jgi:hypothetical protein
MKNNYGVHLLLAAAAFSGNSIAATAKGFEFEPYGFIKASSTYSDAALGTYQNINLAAPTHASAQIRSKDHSSRVSFQAQQSRFGTYIKKGEISGRFEFDFIDFNKSSPTTQMNPRVRIASVTYQLDNHSKFVFGQDWDLYSPVNSFTYDIVGLYFLAGNTGFMRQQFQYIYDSGNYEVGGAVGLAGNNPNPTDNDLELSKTPKFSFRVLKKLETGKVGVSAIYSSLAYQDNGSRHDTYAGNFFYERPVSDLQIKTEAYYGQNVSNIALLGIGKGTSRNDVREYGAHLTVTKKISDKYSLFGGAGGSFIDNRSAITPFSLNANESVANLGIEKNIITRAGIDYKLTPDLSWVTEVTRFQTKTKLADNKYQLNVVPMLESGILLNF